MMKRYLFVQPQYKAHCMPPLQKKVVEDEEKIYDLLSLIETFHS